MPAERKRQRLPFKPPRPQASSSSAGPSASVSESKSKPKAKSRPSTTAARKQATTTKGRKSSLSRPAVEPFSSSLSDANGSDAHSESLSLSEEDVNTGGGGSVRPLSQEPDYILAEIITRDAQSRDVHSSDPTIPPKLLTTLLHHHFKGKKTKITKEANAVVAKYVDVFVREALARAAYERTEGENGNGDENVIANGGRSIGDGFLEVEDLEKLAPQMILDF